MIHQINIYGKDKVEQAIERLRTFEPEEGYYLAFSGGKDSVVVKALADMAGVKYDAHYNVTSVDPPELVQFVKTFPDVSRDIPRDKDGKAITMWNLIPRKRMPPTQLVRYCCASLKENTAQGRFLVTGVRWEESSKRAATRSGLELSDSNMPRSRELLDPDNPDQELIHIYPTKAQRILNPIIDWTTEEVWEFIREYHVPYCRLYDEGFSRLGCIACPMGRAKRMKMELERWPAYRKMYAKAFEKMIELKRSEGKDLIYQNAEEVFRWWFRERGDNDGGLDQATSEDLGQSYRHEGS